MKYIYLKTGILPCYLDSISDTEKRQKKEK